MEFKNKSFILKYSIKKLTDEYDTFDNEKHQNKNGIGLGLNICKSLV